jgi:YD repeat-containing protein
MVVSRNAAGNLIQVGNSLWGPIKYTYDAANRLTALGYPNGITTTHTQDAANRLSGLSAAQGSSTLFGDSFRYAKPGGGTWGLRSTESITDARACWS